MDWLLEPSMAEMLFNNEAVVVELLVAQTLFVYRAPHHAGVRRRAVVGVAAMLAVGLALTYLVLPGTGGAVPPLVRSIINFALMYAATNAAIWYVFRCGMRMVLVACICGYAIQHIASAATWIGHLLRVLVPLPFWHTWLAGELMRIVLFAIVYAAGWMLMIRRFDITKLRTSSPRVLLFLIGSVLAISLGLSSYASHGGASPTSQFVFRAVSILACVMILIVFDELSRNQALSDEVAFMKRMNDMRTDYYETLRDTIETTNIRYHDFKHQIARLRAAGGGGERNAVLDEMSAPVETYDGIAKTGNAALDVVLTEKSLECSRKRIRFTYMIDAECLTGVSDYDIYSVFGNALDNAIEASEQLSDPERRVIKLTGVRRGRLVNIHVTNYYDHVDCDGDGNLVTSKSDASAHGYGVKSIRMTIGRLGGDVDITAADGIFDLNIVFPCGA